MEKRRKRPAPPFVLGSHFLRAPHNSKAGSALLELADFLNTLGALTGGGEKNLQAQLRGRDGSVHLGLQDVCSWAHGLAKLLVESYLYHQDSWKSQAQLYLGSYDKGKVRRPTHLQRLIMEWSPDFHWLGLLKACQKHPHLWEEVELAISRHPDPCPEKRWLALANQCRNDSSVWLKSLETEGLSSGLLQILREFAWAPPLWRIEFAAQRIREQKVAPAMMVHLLESCLCSLEEARELPKSHDAYTLLENHLLERIESSGESVPPKLLVSIRSVCTRLEIVDRAIESLSLQDPLRRVRFGSRPGKSWLTNFREECREIIALRNS